MCGVSLAGFSPLLRKAASVRNIKKNHCNKMTKIFLILILTFFSFSVYSQDCPQNYINAESDSLYFCKTFKYLFDKIGYECPMTSTPDWDNNYCIAPRYLTYMFLIKIKCDGTIQSIETQKAEFSCVNKNGEIVKEDMKNTDFMGLNKENCYKEKIMNLKNITPLMINNINQNVEMPFYINFTGF